MTLPDLEALWFEEVDEPKPSSFVKLLRRFLSSDELVSDLGAMSASVHPLFFVRRPLRRLRKNPSDSSEKSAHAVCVTDGEVSRVAEAMARRRGLLAKKNGTRRSNEKRVNVPFKERIRSKRKGN